MLAYEKSIAIGYRLPDGTNNTITWDIRDIEVAFDNSLQATKISNLKEYGARLLVAGKESKDFIQQLQAEQNKPWHKKSQNKRIRCGICLFFWELVGVFW